MSETEGRASSPCLTCVGWWGKIELPPLTLTVLGGMTRAHLDNSSHAYSPYLNCIGWQDKPTVEQLLCRWCLMLHFLAVAIWTLSGHHNLASSPFWSLLFGGQYRLIMISTLLPRHHTFLMLSNWLRTCTALSLSLGQQNRGKNNRMVIVGLRLVSS